MKKAVVFGAGLSGHGAKELLEKNGYGREIGRASCRERV